MIKLKQLINQDDNLISNKYIIREIYNTTKVIKKSLDEFLQTLKRYQYIDNYQSPIKEYHSHEFDPDVQFSIIIGLDYNPFKNTQTKILKMFKTLTRQEIFQIKYRKTYPSGKYRIIVQSSYIPEEWFFIDGKSKNDIKQKLTRCIAKFDG